MWSYKLSGFPHFLSQDDTYRDFHLPAGATIIGNIWLVAQLRPTLFRKAYLENRAMCHDENKYSSPDTFDPERFLMPDGTLNLEVQDPETLVFGFGRRVCPGKWFALESAWVMVARMLSVYEIGKSLHMDGSVPRSEGEFTSGLARYGSSVV